MIIKPWAKKSSQNTIPFQILHDCLNSNFPSNSRSVGVLLSFLPLYVQMYRSTARIPQLYVAAIKATS